MKILAKLRSGGHSKPPTYRAACACGAVVIVKDYPKRVETSRYTGEPRRCTSCTLRGNNRRRKYYIMGWTLEEQRRAVELWTEIYDSPGGGAGCCLHVTLDDGNVSDEGVQGDVERIEHIGHPACIELARLLVKASKTQRLKLGRRGYLGQGVRVEVPPTPPTKGLTFVFVEGGSFPGPPLIDLPGVNAPPLKRDK